MKVKELIEELMTCNPESTVVCLLDGEPFMQIIQCVRPLDKNDEVMLCVAQPEYF